jgi:polysaccharide chain length determinant protein (PEP-CTERM system associated)
VNELYRQLLFYVTFCWRRRWLALATAWFVCVLGWSVVTFLPDQYVASGKIYIETQSVLQPLLRGLAIESDIGAQVAVMQQTLLTRANLEEVARRTDLDISAHSPLQVDRLLEDLQRRIEVAGQQKNLFSISVVDTVPRRAKETVDALVNIFVEGNLGQNRTDMDMAEKFLVNQIKEYEQKLQESEQKLAAFKKIYVEYVPSDDENLQRGIGYFQQQLHEEKKALEDTEFSLKDLVQKRNVLQQELARTPEVLSYGAGGAASPDARAARLAELQEALYNMLSKFTEQHPDVIALRQEIERLQTAGDYGRKAVHDPSPPSGGASTPNGVVNLVYMQLKLQLVEVESDIARLQGMVSRRQAVVQRLETMAQRAPQIEAELKTLNRDYEIIKSQHDELLKRRESARLSQHRDAGTQLTQFRIVEPPQIPTEAIAPNRKLLLSAVIPIAIAVGIGLAIILPLLRDSYFDVKRLRADFGLAVLGAVSYAQKSRLGARSLRTTAFAGGIACLLIVYGLLLAVDAEAGLGAVASRSLERASLEPVVDALHRVASSRLGLW